MSTKLLKNALRGGLYMAVALTIGGGGVAHSADYKMPRMLVIGTAGTSSGSFASTNGWAPTFQKDMGSMARIVPEDSDPQRYLRLTDRRDLTISSVSTADMRFQIEGIGAYASSKPVAQRIIWHHNDTPWGFVTRGDSELKTIEDLKKGGVRVARGEFSPPMTAAAAKALPAYLGMSDDEVAEKLSFVPASSYAENCRSVVEGKADVAYCASTSAVLAEMEGAPGGIRWLPMAADNAEGWDGFLKHRPMVVPSEITLGVSTARGVAGLTSNFVYAVPADAEEEFAYNMAKWFHESFDKYKGSHPLAARMDIEVFRNYLDRAPLPIHEGTIRYLKEVGVWTEADDVWNQQAVEKMDRWLGARQAALDEARANRIAASHNNQEFMKILSKHTEGLEGFRSRL